VTQKRPPARVSEIRVSRDRPRPEHLASRASNPIAFPSERVAGRGGRLYAARGTIVTVVPQGNVTVTNDPRRRRERLSVVGVSVTRARLCFAFAAKSLTQSRNKKPVDVVTVTMLLRMASKSDIRRYGVLRRYSAPVSPLRTASPSSVSLYFPARVCVTSFFMPLMARATFTLWGSPLNNRHPIFMARDDSEAFGSA
jgi:hypothetical protein